MHYLTKSLEELNVLDDFLFSAAASDPEVGTAFCRTLLSVLLQREIGDIRIVAQRTLPAPSPQMRGIRMDVEIEEIGNAGDTDPSAISTKEAGETGGRSLCGDATASGTCENTVASGTCENTVAPGARKDTGTPCVYNVYDIEPHLREDMNLPKHNRFYQARMDSRYMKRGDNDFDHMPDLYILTITTYDPFGYDYMAYTIENRCREVPELKYRDGVHQIYFYTKGKKGGCKALGNMLNYLQRSTEENAMDNATQTLHDCVRKVKIQPEVRTAYMKLDDLLYFARKDGRSEGRESGLAEGLELGRSEGLELGRSEGLELGRSEGLENGIKKGHHDINALNMKLLNENRIEDLQRATADPAYQAQLIQEFFPNHE